MFNRLLKYFPENQLIGTDAIRNPYARDPMLMWVEIKEALNYKKNECPPSQ